MQFVPYIFARDGQKKLVAILERLGRELLSGGHGAGAFCVKFYVQAVRRKQEMGHAGAAKTTFAHFEKRTDRVTNMNILIIGCGRVGRRLVGVLERLGHDVSVLDADAANLGLLREMEPPFSGMALAGMPTDGDVLRSAGIEACDVVAAVTDDDNINLMAAQIAQKVFGVGHVIARVEEPSRKEVYTARFGLRIVCGTNLTAQGLLAGILQEEDSETQCVVFGSSTANFSTVPAPQALYSRPLAEAKPPRPGMQIFGVQRANGTMELACTAPLVYAEDKIVFAELAD